MRLENVAAPPVRLERIRILHVEDHKDTAVGVLRLLRTLNICTVIALDAEEAVSLCQKCSFDLLLCDLQLPDGNGVDLIRRLVGSGCTRALVLSGHRTPELLRQCEELGVEHLLKPIETDDLIGAIMRTLDYPSQAKGVS